ERVPGRGPLPDRQPARPGRDADLRRRNGGGVSTDGKIEMLEEIPDEQLKYLVLGWLRHSVAMDHFPLHLREIGEELDENKDVEGFVITTRSGLRFRVRVDYLEGKEE